jgi:PAS domain S-box-containing protein
LEISNLPQELIDSIPISISVHQEGKVVYANSKCQEISGYPTIEKLIGVCFSDHIHPDDIDKVSKARENGVSLINNIRIIDYNGETKFINVSFMEANWMGNPAIVQFTHDITQQTGQTNRLGAIHKYSIETRDLFILDEIAEKTLQTISNLLKTKICSLSLVEGNQLNFRYQSTHSSIDKLSLDTPAVTTRAARTGKTQRISDVRKDPDYQEWTTSTIRSELAVPIKLDEVVGVINIESEQTDAFSEDDQRLVEILAEQFASEREKVRYIEQVEHLERNRSRELLEGRNQVTRMVKHDLKGPLTIINNCAYLMKTPESDIQELSTLISENVSRVNEIIDDLGQMTLTEEIAPVPTDLVSLIRETVKSNNIPSNIRVKIEPSQEMLYMSLDAAKIRRAFDNLIRNSVEAMPQGGKLTIKIDSDTNKTYITIKDTSPGILPENRDKVFKLFFTTKEKGTGLGLSIVKQIIEAHKGTITLENTDMEGTSFKIMLPM